MAKVDIEIVARSILIGLAPLASADTGSALCDVVFSDEYWAFISTPNSATAVNYQVLWEDAYSDHFEEVQQFLSGPAQYLLAHRKMAGGDGPDQSSATRLDWLEPLLTELKIVAARERAA